MTQSQQPPPFAQPRTAYPGWTPPTPKKKILARLRESTTFHVAVTAAAGAVAAYYGTTKAVKGHTIDVYFKIEDELDNYAQAAKKAKKKHKKN